MKKRLLTTIAVVLFVTSAAFSQIEVKINPIGLLFNGISASGEYILNDNMGVEVSLRLASRNIAFNTDADSKLTGFGAGGAFKYYFSPDLGADKFYAGAYLRYAGLKGTYLGSLSQIDETVTYTKVAFGFNAGYKWVASSGLLFEVGTGVGRNLTSKWSYSDGDDSSFSFNLPIDFTYRVSVGWRF